MCTVCGWTGQNFLMHAHLFVIQLHSVQFVSCLCACVSKLHACHTRSAYQIRSGMEGAVEEGALTWAFSSLSVYYIRRFVVTWWPPTWRTKADCCFELEEKEDRLCTPSEEADGLDYRSAGELVVSEAVLRSTNCGYTLGLWERDAPKWIVSGRDGTHVGVIGIWSWRFRLRICLNNKLLVTMKLYGIILTGYTLFHNNWSNLRRAS